MTYINAACGHIQSIDILPLSLLFDSDYTYKPSNNPALIKHFNQYADLVEDFLRNNKPTRVLILAQTIDCFLKPKRRGFDVLRLANLRRCSIAASEIYQQFKIFLLRLSNKILDQHGKFTHISANNVYAHNDNLMGFFAGVSNLLSESGIFTFEINYLVDIVNKALLGTIFHDTCHTTHYFL